MRWGMVYILVAVAAWSGLAAADLDVEELSRRIARQEASIRDMEAKAALMADYGGGGAASGVTSLRKNATVTLGGLVTTGYYFLAGKAMGEARPRPPGAASS